jgi:adenine-specific DNA-methyltransferase
MASLYFKGKSAVWNHHLSVPYHTLEKDDKASLKGKHDEENLIIEGDNLLALKALLPKYQGKIKCIYIDPPYNTGNENWIYNDNVNSPLIKDWVGKTVGTDDLTRHDKWLCMMTPRLKLLYELLAEDGMLFISIDENEQHSLRMLMNEIFTEKNYLNTFCWLNNLKGRQISGVGAAKTFEYVVCYAKNIENTELFEIIIEKAKSLMPSSYKGFNYETESDNGGEFVVKNELYNTNSAFNEETRPNLVFNIHYNFKTNEVKFSGIDEKIEFSDFAKISPKKNNDGKHKYHAWRWGKDKIIREVSDLKFVKAENGNVRIFTKIRGYDTTSLKDIITDITTSNGANDIKELFNAKIFDYPKPVDLIKIILSQTGDEDIILDSFAGSGTTAQAVLELNKEDGQNRKFILVQLPEKIEKGTVAYEAGYRHVAEITRDRAKKVIERDKTKTGFTYYTLGPSVDADSILSGKLPKYEEFAKYVFYLATGRNYPTTQKIREKDYFVGKLGSESIYLIYEQSLNSLKNMAVTLDWAEATNKKDSGKKIVYAPACFLDDEHLEKFNIQFVSIPYNLFEKK